MPFSRFQFILSFLVVFLGLSNAAVAMTAPVQFKRLCSGFLLRHNVEGRGVTKVDA
jgi:hypothetical protein